MLPDISALIIQGCPPYSLATRIASFKMRSTPSMGASQSCSPRQVRRRHWFHTKPRPTNEWATDANEPSQRSTTKIHYSHRDATTSPPQPQ